MSFNETKIHGTPDFPIELYHVDSTHPRYEMVFHWHTNIELIRVISGELLVSLNKKEFTAKPGDIIIVNSETVHGAFPKDCVYECIVYNPDFIPFLPGKDESFAEKLCGGSVKLREFFPAGDGDISNCINGIFEALTVSDEGAHYLALGRFCQMYGLMLRHKCYTDISTSSKMSSNSIVKLKNVLRYIRNSYDTAITLEDMAKYADMSVGYFCSFFKSHTHKTPVEYLMTYRIEKAAHKLLVTDKSVTEIAYSCGFNDLSYFIKTFKRIKGTTPKVFRK